jgi:YgiT-type zinc finger domain-containing protein
MVERLPGEVETMKCLYCHGQMQRGTTPVHIDRRGCHLILDCVPAWICEQCGEAYFEEREVEAIQGLVQAIEPKARALAESV